MSQFGGGGKPGGWGRPGGPPGGGGQLPGFGVGNFSMMGLPMINQAAFSQQGMMGMGVMGAVPPQANRPSAPSAGNVSSPSGGGTKNRTFVGVVTKMHDSYGFVDDDVFFQHTVIRGANPRVGDKVMVEASYNPQMPFKWNAYRVQLLTNPGATAVDSMPPSGRGASPMRGGHAHQSSRNGPPAASGGPSSRWGGGPSDRNGGSRGSPPRRRSPPRRSPPPRRSSPPRQSHGPVKRRTRSPLAPRRSPPPRRSSPPPSKERKRDRSQAPSVAPSIKRDSASPPRRRARIIPRYECRTTKPVLISDHVSVVHVRGRYPKMYVPSDFVDLSVDWPKRVPLDSNIDTTNPISFHVMHKDVDCPKIGDEAGQETAEPTDCDNSHQVKVLLLSHAGKEELLKKSFGLLPDGSTDDSHEVTSMFKHLQFLVGARGKEHMAIGGSWSPSLDGPDPTNPATLIKTAIRTTRAMTGIDLSNVPQWYSMVQVRYYRSEKDRVDRVHLLLPDTQLLMPDAAAWEAQTGALQKQLADKLAEIEAASLRDEKAAVQPAATVKGSVTSTPVKAAEEPKPEETTTPAKDDEAAELAALTEKPKPTPSHWNDLDVKVMKVAELKTELDARGLETRGIKTLLAARLQEALDREQELEEDDPDECEEVEEVDDIEMKDEVEEKTEEKKGEETKTEEEKKTEESKAEEKKTEVVTIDETTKSEEELKKEAEELQKKVEKLEKEKKEKKASLERHFAIPKEPKILVYPSKTAKGGKYECKVVSVQTLLDYRLDDNKESQFEVSLFVEAFKELLERHAAFAIYHALSSAADKESERKRRDEARTAPVEEPTETDAEKKDEDKEKEKSEKPPKIELKGVVSNRSLFEAFAMFDANLCSYLSARDLEDILLNGEFGTTRNLVNKLAQKLSSRDKINYRNLTDRLVDSDGNVKFEPGHAEGCPSLEKLARGFGAQYVASTAQQSSETNGVAASSDGTVVINGNVINVAQKLALLKKSEQERDAAKAALNEQNSLIAQLRDAKHELEKKKKEVEKELEKNKKKLSDTGSALKSSLEDGGGLKSSLTDCRRYAERILGVIDKAYPPLKDEKKSEEKDKSKEVKSEKKGEKTKTEELEEIPAETLVLSDETGPEAELEQPAEAAEEKTDATQAAAATGEEVKTPTA